MSNIASTIIIPSSTQTPWVSNRHLSFAYFGASKKMLIRREPSNGGIGIRLNSISAMLMMIENTMKTINALVAGKLVNPLSR